jgi:RNA polymerase sigma factor (sigma-70 family)
MTSDSELLRRYADGDQEAFREIVLRHVNVIYFTALRRTGGRTQLAEEVVQDVFAGLAANATRLRDYASPVGWVFVATRFAASKALRRERRRQKREHEVSQMQDIITDGEAATEAWHRIRPIIDPLLDALSEQDRAAVLLRFFENHSFAELGATFRISEDAARMRVDRALARLARQLQRRGIVSTSVLLGAALATQGAVTAPAILANSVALMAVNTATLGGLSGFSYFTLMSTTKMTGAAIAAAILAVSVAVYQSIRRHDSEVALSVSMQQAQAASAQLAASNRRIADLQHEKTELQAELSAQSQKIATLSAAPREARPPATQTADLRRQLEARTLGIKSMLQGFFTQWGIPAKDQDEIVRNLMEPTRIRADASELAEAESRKGTWSREDGAKLDETARQAIQDTYQKLIGLLGGEERVHGMMKYLSDRSSQEIVDRVAGAVYATDAPLNVTSAESLALVLQQNRYAPGDTQRNSAGGAPVSAGDFLRAKPILNELGLGTLPLVTDAAIAEATKILSPGQLAALRQLQEQQLAALKIAKEPPAGPQR